MLLILQDDIKVLKLDVLNNLSKIREASTDRRLREVDKSSITAGLQYPLPGIGRSNMQKISKDIVDLK